jgi:polar amino acid transport system substrate-binding protein
MLEGISFQESQTLRRLLFAVAIALSIATAGPTAAQAPAAPRSTPPPSVTIPNFWDPHARVERPAAGVVPAIRFLTTDDFPPFNFLDDRGQLTGFNVDIARAICAELQIQCTIQVRAFDDLVSHLADKTADAVIAGIAITTDTRATVDFSDVYLRLPARFVTRKADAGMTFTVETLQGKSIAVVGGTAHAAYLAAMFPGVTAKPYSSRDAALGAVRAGEVDAMFGDGQQLGFWLQSAAAAECCALAGGPYLDPRYFGGGYAIAVAKGAIEVTHALNAALHAVYDKGIYADLYLRYFPVGFF